jgi:uncharacterized protein YcnI
MNVPLQGRLRLPLAVVLASGVALIAAAAAGAHARISPPIALSNSLQLFTLAVPTEKSNVTTTKVVLTLPAGFTIDSFVPTPGWNRHVQQSGSGNSAVIQQVTWKAASVEPGGGTPTGEDSAFAFLAQPQSSKTYTFTVVQTYSDGSIVNWSGPESADAPSPTIEAKPSFGGGGSTLALVALVVAAVGVLLGGLTLVSRSGRQLT